MTSPGPPQTSIQNRIRMFEKSNATTNDTGTNSTSVREISTTGNNNKEHHQREQDRHSFDGISLRRQHDRTISNNNARQKADAMMKLKPFPRADKEDSVNSNSTFGTRPEEKDDCRGDVPFRDVTNIHDKVPQIERKEEDCADDIHSKLKLRIAAAAKKRLSSENLSASSRTSNLQPFKDVTNNNNNKAPAEEEIIDIQSQIKTLRSATSNLKKRLPSGELLPPGNSLTSMKKLKPLKSSSNVNVVPPESKKQSDGESMNSQVKNATMGSQSSDDNTSTPSRRLPQTKSPIRSIPRQKQVRNDDEVMKAISESLQPDDNPTTPKKSQKRDSPATLGTIPKKKKQIKRESPAKFKRTVSQKIVPLQNSLSDNSTVASNTIVSEKLSTTRRQHTSNIVNHFKTISNSKNQTDVSNEFNSCSEEKPLGLTPGDISSYYIEQESLKKQEEIRTPKQTMDCPVIKAQEIPAEPGSNTPIAPTPQNIEEKFLDRSPQSRPLPASTDQNVPKKFEENLLRTPKKIVSSPELNVQDIFTPGSHNKTPTQQQQILEFSPIAEPSNTTKLEHNISRTSKEVVSSPELNFLEISTPGSNTKIPTKQQQILVFSPIAETSNITRGARVNKNHRKRKTLKRFWELLYAALAILELTTCSQTIIMANKTTQMEVCSATESPPFAVTAVTQSLCETNNSGQQEEKISRKRAAQEEQISDINGPYATAFRKFFDTVYRPLVQDVWQEWINTAFMFAVIVHISLESWSRASAKNEEKRHKEETEAKMTLVTGRSSKRRTVLDESSYNRHFIRKWSRNRIKWSRTTTDIAKAAAFLVALQLLAIPVLRDYSPLAKTKKKIIKLLLPGLKKKKSSKVAAAAASTTFSLGEIFLMKVSSWCQSNGVKALKKALFKIIRAVIFRPKKISKIFTWIRWAKFVAPLVGATNKLRGNWIDLMTKRDQRRRRNQLRKVVDKESQRTIRAICKLQAKFRAERARKNNHKGQQMMLGTVSNTSKSRSRRSKKENRRRLRHKKLTLLLRPNTTFSVGWKIITVSCVFFELLSKLLLVPKFPTPTTNVIAVNNLLKILLAPSVAYIVRLVSFFDVFLSFFTGELDKTGQLVPKPFFKRYILPGLGLQLLVNPTLKDISKVVMAFIKWSLRVGPSRMLHIALALQPVIRGLFNFSIEFLFLFVSAWNRLPKKRVTNYSLTSE